MSLFKPPRGSGRAALAVCSRCKRKVYYDDLKQDPNNQNWYCPACVDLYDPWRLPARVTENISLDHPRPETELTGAGFGTYSYIQDNGVPESPPPETDPGREIVVVPETPDTECILGADGLDMGLSDDLNNTLGVPCEV